MSPRHEARNRTALPARLFGALLRRLVPSLGGACTAEAVATFEELWLEATRSGPGARASFLIREARALVATAREERELAAGKSRDGSTKGLGERGPRPGAGPATTSAAAFTPGAAGPGSPGGLPSRPSHRRTLTALLDFLRWDLRLALRNLARSPGFVAISVLSLTFGIGTSTVLFTVANSVLFRPAPYVADPGELVRIYTTSRGLGRGPSAYPDLEDYRRMVGSLQGIAAVRGGDFVANTTSEATRLLKGRQVSENYFDLLGIPLARGRGFLAEDVAAGGQVAVIGWDLWQRDYDADPGILGRILRLNGKPHTIVGVGPQGMTALSDPSFVEVLVPVMEAREQRGHQSLGVVGRLRKGATLPQVQAELDAAARHLAEDYPNEWNHFGDNPRGLQAIPELRARIPAEVPVGALVGGFLAVVGLILLIACSNVANLLLSRALSRGTEVAVRSALGAPRRRILAQFLTENLLLFGGSGGMGLLLAFVLTKVARASLPAIGFPGANLAVDLRVAGFALGVGLLTGLSFGLLPAMQASRTDLVSGLKRIHAGGRIRKTSLTSLLVGAQVAGSLVLVLVTLLLVQGLSHARELDLGFDPNRVAVLSVDLSHRDYGEEEGRSFLATLSERLAALPGVEGVALGTFIPLQGGGHYYGGLVPEGYEPSPQEGVSVGFASVSPGYLDVVGMGLLRGRDFGLQDDAAGVRVALVNQAFVDRHWPGEEGVGRRIGMRGREESLEVVGVVADSKYQTVDEEPGPHLWLPFAQSYSGDVIVHVRTSGDPRNLLPTLRQQVRDLDPELPILRSETMAAITSNATAPQRILSMILGAMGLVAVALAMLGIYGVIGYSVSQRTREVGLRIALGAHPRGLVGMVVREGMVLSLLGLIPGLGLGAGAAFLLRSILMGINPLSPMAVGGSVVLLMVASAMASLAPALRAARAHPMESLRVE